MERDKTRSEYKTRKIKFEELVQCGDWTVKVYSIAKNGEFNAHEIYKNALAHLPQWLKMNNSFDPSNDKIAFLIVHSGTEGIFSIVNWWVGTNMLNTHIFLTAPETPNAFKKISGDGLCPCIWELEVINHERNSWIRNVLKKPTAPDFQKYLTDQYHGEI